MGEAWGREVSAYGAMIDYALVKVSGVVPKVKTTDVERPYEDVQDSELPLCMAYDVAGDNNPIEFFQMEEVTSITLAFMDKFESTENALRSLLDTYVLIKRAFIDGNVIDSDAAGFKAYVSSWGTGKAEPESDRHYLVMEVLFLTVDVEDSAFALAEVNT